jgi:hypothetical protein
MSARDNTFIHAYGLELNDELEAAYAEPTRQEAEAVHEPMQSDATRASERSYRFDAAARRRALRGPHFDLRRVVSPTNDETPDWNAFDMNVIDVGAAWAPSPVVQPSFDKEVDVAESEESVETRQEDTEFAAPVVTQPEVTAVDAEEVMPPERPITVHRFGGAFLTRVGSRSVSLAGRSRAAI